MFNPVKYSLPEDKKVNPFLAITPAQMERMAFENKAISANVLAAQAYYNGDSLEAEFRRGADINEIWERGQISRSKLKEYDNTESRRRRIYQREVKEV